MKKIIIIGTRKRDTDKDFLTVYNEFRNYYEDGDVIISGGCPKGGDRFAELIAQRIGSTEENGKLIIHRPIKPPIGSPRWAWTKAFYARNELVAKEGEESTIVIACVSPYKPGGTEHTLGIIEKIGIIKKENIKRV